MHCKIVRLRAARVLSFLLSALLPGCGHIKAPRTTYLAVVEGIDDREGDFYSPTKGRKPLIRVQLRLPSGPNTTDILNVLILDLFSAQVYGDLGDTVSFAYSSRLP